VLYLLLVCLNVLYDGWSPALTVTSVCLSILSMLSSATEKVGYKLSYFFFFAHHIVCVCVK